MAIQALPEGVSRVLRSSQVIINPAALVKELVDNALDAKATSIEIVIAQNTLDKIEVRDNGHGIIPDDLDALGRRGHTSKLRNFEELKLLGGTSLGFRGEALASAVQLGQVFVTSRAEGETVAVKVKLRPHGGVESRSSTSHPVGTTIGITNLFSGLPVRRQTALKEAKQTLSRMKDLLQAYALARLKIRLSLKVSKAEKLKWSIAPRPKDTVREIVSQVISRDVAAQCIEINSTPVPVDDELSHHSSLTEPFQSSLDNGFVFQAFIPKPDADVSKIHGRSYISIDSRPVSCTRGSTKKLVTIYKNILNQTGPQSTSEKLKEPFMRLNIVCPAGSYDSNVEPAKDDVLFEDEADLLSTFEHWLRDIYCQPIGPSQVIEVALDDGESEVIEPHMVQPGAVQSLPLVIGDPTRADHSNDGGRYTHRGAKETESIPINQDSSVICLDMSEDYSEVVEQDRHAAQAYQSAATDTSNPPDNSTPSSDMNPWVIAKVNAPATRHDRTTSSAKRPLTGPPNASSSHEYSSPPPSHTRHRLTNPVEALCTANARQTSLDGWQQSRRSIDRQAQRNFQSGNTATPEPVRRTGIMDASNGSPEQGVTGHSLLQTPPATTERPKPRGLHKAFVPLMPIRSNPRDSFAEIYGANESGLGASLRDFGHIARLMGNPGSVERGYTSSPIVEEALDFERRKESASAKLRTEIRRSQTTSDSGDHVVPTILQPQPIHPTNKAAILPSGADESAQKDTAPAETALPDDDPRAYLMRRQRSMRLGTGKHDQQKRLRRAKTLLLPLETTAKHMEVHKLELVIHVDAEHIRNAITRHAVYDEYAKHGKVSKAFDTLTVEVEVVERQLKAAVTKHLGPTQAEEVQIVYDLSPLRRRIAGKMRSTPEQ
jgi:DNA mismatch repair protein MutL